MVSIRVKSRRGERRRSGGVGERWRRDVGGEERVINEGGTAENYTVVCDGGTISGCETEQHDSAA